MWYFKNLFSYMVKIQSTYGLHMGTDHVYVNCGVWTLVSKIGDQVFATTQLGFLWYKMSWIVFETYLYFKSYTNVNLKLQCFIDILFKWKKLKKALNVFSKIYAFIFFS
jgi:hypothetical protein